MNVGLSDLVKVTFSAYILPQLGEVTCWFKVASVTGGSVSLTEIASTIHAVCSADWQAATIAQVKLQSVSVGLYDKTTGRQVARGDLVDGVTVGTVTGNLCPKQAAAVVKKLTDFTGRNRRGRVYWPFVPVSFVNTSGDLTGAAVTAYQALSSDFLSTLVVTGAGGTATLNPVLVGKLLPLDSVPITSIQVTGKIGNQRRRGDYGQPNTP